MTNIIHMETDVVQASARQLEQTAVETQQEIATLAGAIRSLDWQGGARDQFAIDFGNLEKRFNELTEQGTILSRRMRAEVDEWVAAAASLGTGGGSGPASQNQIVSDGKNKIRNEWKDMTFEERKQWIEDYYKDLCKKLGMPETDFKVEDLRDPDNGDYRGSYNNGGIFGWFRSLTIDSDNVKGDDPFEVMETIGHETRHQYQHYLVEHPDKRPANISEETVKSWKDNINNYKRAENDYEAYRNQPIEADARQAGEQAADEYINNRAKAI